MSQIELNSTLIDVLQTQQRLDGAEELGSDDIGRKYLSFYIGGEMFASDILNVQEIRGWERPTALPNAPDYLLGVLNLRGTIVPVIDLRIRFGFTHWIYDKTTAIIILKTISESRERWMGCVVDTVSDVISCEDSSIKNLPSDGGTVDGLFIQGVMNVNQQGITLLNLENLLSLKLINHPFAGDLNIHG